MPEGHDLAKDVVAALGSHGAVIQPIDLALDRLDDCQVLGQHLVGDRSHESRRIQGPEARLTLGHGVEPLEFGGRAVVHGEDPVATADDIDDPGRRRLGRSAALGGRVDGAQGEVEVVGVFRQVGPSRRRDELRGEGRFQVERLGGRSEVVTARRPIDVDPEQLALVEARRQSFGKVDVAILTVRIVQARPQAAVWDGGQRIDPRSIAPTIARIASPY